MGAQSKDYLSLLGIELETEVGMAAGGFIEDICVERT